MPLPDDPERQYAHHLRNRAENLEAVAFCLYFGAFVTGLATYSQVNTQLLSSGTGTSSLGALVAWGLLTVVVGTSATGFLAVGLLLRALADSAEKGETATAE